MGELRNIEQFYVELNEILGLADLEEALLRLSRLVGQHYREESVAYEYDQFTGKAIKHKWVQTPQLWYGPVYAYKTPFGQALKDLIPEREIRGFNLPDGEILLVVHVRELMEDRGTEPAHFTFQRLKMLEI